MDIPITRQKEVEVLLAGDARKVPFAEQDLLHL